jgi:hypothetical protein
MEIEKAAVLTEFVVIATVIGRSIDISKKKCRKQCAALRVELIDLL